MPLDLVVAQLDFAGVNSGANLEVDAGQRVSDIREGVVPSLAQLPLDHL
jgi:hypothetical protein